jgi:putative DNA primase/helicase
MTAREIAAALGGAYRSGAWSRCICPVHGSLGATLALRDGERGLIVKCFGGCHPRDLLAELRRRGLLDGRIDGARSAPPVPQPHRNDDASRIAAARRIWDAAGDARGSPVEPYLAGRAIDMPPPPSLRWAPRCWHREARAHLPAMVALVEHVARGVVGVHRTYLARDDAESWRRRDRASLGPIAGGAVRLAPAADTLMVGEGVETCLAAMQAWPLPAWAALSTSGLVALMLPPSVGTVVILADCDANGAGERVAYAAADRWLSEDRRVKIAMPPEPGIDFNDVLLGRAYARVTEAGDVAA